MGKSSSMRRGEVSFALVGKRAIKKLICLKRKQKLLGVREANRRGLRNGQVCVETIRYESNKVFYQWRYNIWSSWTTGEIATVAVWRSKDTSEDHIVLKTFDKQSTWKHLIKSSSNLAYNIIRHNKVVENNVHALLEEQGLNLTERLVAIIADDLRMDLYDDIKRYVVFGTTNNTNSVGMLVNRGLLWDDGTVPDEVRKYFMDRHELNPVTNAL